MTQAGLRTINEAQFVDSGGAELVCPCASATDMHLSIETHTGTTIILYSQTSLKGVVLAGATPCHLTDVLQLEAHAFSPPLSGENTLPLAGWVCLTLLRHRRVFTLAESLTEQKPGSHVLSLSPLS